MKGIARDKATDGKRGADAIPYSTVVKNVASLRAENTDHALRDAVVLAVGFLGGFRRSELAGLRMSDVVVVDGGVDVAVRKSKTDQAGQGVVVALPQGKLDIRGLVQDWKAFAGGNGNSFFVRSVRNGVVSSHGVQSNGSAVDRIVKARLGKGYSAHGLRSGFVIAAFDGGATIDKVQAVTRHKNVAVLMGYAKHADRYKNAAASTFDVE